MSHPEDIIFKFGHHTKSDNPHLVPFKGFFYNKYYVCSEHSFPQPPLGTEMVTISCPVCNDTVTIRLSSAGTVASWSLFYRTLGSLIATFTIFLFLQYPDYWELWVVWPGLFAVYFWFMYRSKAAVVKDFNFNFYGHKILWK